MKVSSETTLWIELDTYSVFCTGFCFFQHRWKTLNSVSVDLPENAGDIILYTVFRVSVL